MKYVETIDEGWLQEGADFIKGHMYAHVYSPEEDAWIWVDPMLGRLDQPPQDRAVLEEGLDGWDIGITDYSSLRLRYHAFRKVWLEQQNNSDSSQIDEATEAPHTTV